MPKRCKKYCNYPGCYEIATDDSAYCQEHKRKVHKNYEMTRETAVQRGYDTRWRKIRAMVLKKEPMCQCDECGGTAKIADVVHHIDGNVNNNNMANLMSINGECHNRLHALRGDRWRRW